MDIWVDCLPCMAKMSLDLARLTIKEEYKVKALMTYVFSLPAFRGEEWSIKSPDIVKMIWEKIVSITGDENPMVGIKAEQNRKALKIYDAAQRQMRKAADPFLTALKFAIAGNSIDTMVDLSGRILAEDLQDDVTSGWHITEDGVGTLRDRLSEAKNIVYLLDNCGEIVLDRLFLEVLKEMYELEVTMVARSQPVLNDATVADAESVGLRGIGPIIENGIPRPYAGTKLPLVSAEVRRLLGSADLIVSKGGANFETLCDEQELNGRISFLIHGKCHPICVSRGVSVGTLIVDNEERRKHSEV